MRGSGGGERCVLRTTASVSDRTQRSPPLIPGLVYRSPTVARSVTTGLSRHASPRARPSRVFAICAAAGLGPPGVLDWLSVSLPVACYGDFKARLLITGLAPLVLAATMVAGCILWAVSSRALRSSRKLESGEIISATKDGLFRALPSTLLLSFVLVPAVSKKIFSSFDCVSYDFDTAAGESREFLRDDPSI